MDADSSLLGRFVDEGAQDAFATLVQRKIDLVYAAALRQVGGDTHLAQDVTQGVFVALACRAQDLRRHASLAGWLYTTTRFLAAKTVRSQSRRQRREAEAHKMMLPEKAGRPWSELRPVIDEAMHELGEKDRTALLLRFFDGRSLAEVGAAIGVAENAARMRVERALEKLRGQLARRGITSTAAALGGTLAAHAHAIAPAGLAASATQAGIAAAAAGAIGGSGAGLAFITMSKMKLTGIAALVLAGALGCLMVQRHADTRVNEANQRAARLEREMAALRAEREALRARSSAVVTTPARDAAPAVTESPPANASVVQLRMLQDLQRRGLIRTGLTMVEVEGNILPAWAEVFGLSEPEVKAMNRAIEDARQQLGRLELTHASAQAQPDGSVVITVQPFAEGAAIWDSLTGSIASVLGPERYAAFATFGLKDLEDRLNQLGTARQTLTLRHDRNAADPRRAYSLAMRVERADGTVKQGTASDSRPDRLIGFMLGPLTSLLPPGF